MKRSNLRKAFALVVGPALIGLTGAAHAIEYLSVVEPALLYDAPSDKGRRLFIVATGTPVEVVVTLDKWVKVREPGGSLTWIERRALTDKRTVMITADRVAVRRQAQESAPVAFEASRNVILELVEPPAAGWAKVRHADGATGFLRVGEAWGL